MTTLTWLIFAAASGLFWAGVIADSSSSGKMMEKTKFFRRADGKFNRPKYLLTMLAIQGAALAFVLIARDQWLTIAASAMLVVGGVLRFRVAARNRKLHKQAGL